MNGNTVGALDMGGASTQITFVPTKPAENSNKLTLYGKEYEVYTHSFLCYGLKEAQIKFLAQLVKATVCLTFTSLLFPSRKTKHENTCKSYVAVNTFMVNFTCTHVWGYTEKIFCNNYDN